jgi:hypothetical protein
LSRKYWICCHWCCVFSADGSLAQINNLSIDLRIQSTLLRQTWLRSSLIFLKTAFMSSHGSRFMNFSTLSLCRSRLPDNLSW